MDNLKRKRHPELYIVQLKCNNLKRWRTSQTKQSTIEKEQPKKVEDRATLNELWKYDAGLEVFTFLSSCPLKIDTKVLFPLLRIFSHEKIEMKNKRSFDILIDNGE